jgi:IclR family mhp operon transcriptional activator
VTTYKKNQSIVRGLNALLVVSNNPGLSRAQISKRVNLNRSTVYRILETLEELGYVRRSTSNDSYYVTSLTSQLVGDTANHSIILDAATSFLRKLNNSIDWPASIILQKDGEMVICETTHGRSKTYVHNVGIGTKVPMLTSAAGHVYLSYCGTQERNKIFKQYAAQIAQQRGGMQAFNKILAKTRRQGYAICLGATEECLNGIAMPLRHNNMVVASMNIVFLSGCVKEKEVLQRYLPKLKKTVIQIEKRLNQ